MIKSKVLIDLLERADVSKPLVSLIGFPVPPSVIVLILEHPSVMLVLVTRIDGNSIEVKPVQLQKQSFPKLVASGNSIEVKLVQPWKQKLSKLVTFGAVTEVKPVQSRKQLSPKLVTFGNVTEVKLEHSQKQSLPKLVASGNSIEVKHLQA